MSSSNDLQLSLNAGLPTQAGAWAGGPLGAASSPASAADHTPLHKAHRLLRGRYALAVVLGILGAAVGAAAGFLSQKPAYKSTGTLEIDFKVPRSGAELDKIMVGANSYMNSQMAKLGSEKVVRAALRNRKWQVVRPNNGSEGDVAAFANALTVGPPKGASLIGNTFIQVSYSDSAPDAQKVSPIAVSAVIDAFTDLFSSQDAKELERRVSHLRDQQREDDATIEMKRKQIVAMAKQGSENDRAVVEAQSRELITFKKNWQDGEEMLAQAEQDLKAVDSGTARKTSPEDWGRVDPTMERFVQMRNDLDQRIDSLESQLGPNHPVVTRSKQDKEARERAMAKYADELNSKFMIRWKSDGTGGSLIARDLGGLREFVQRAKALYERERQRVNEMRGVVEEISILRDQINTTQARMKEVDDQLRELNFQKEFLGPGRIHVVSPGDIAAVDKDRRPMFAALGFMGGAGVPIGLLMLIGLLDSRYRYSDETAQATAGLTLLGILPNLPDRLSDPEQAAIAAHCVHQIRTMLQINGSEERRVFAITSATPGDGKTSLTLALGLSYAACGTRTLLIDCDLIGAGLTSRMNVNAAEGVLEAIANRNLLGYVRGTDIADVAMLPVGSAGNLHASTLSPAALRRLIDEASKNFETILIDTGPVLGSIEASLVCAAADATVLVVSRGQQRPMVEKSLGHLTAIGARLAGVVFNRAQSQDFERSISGVSMRSVGQHGPRTRAGRIGPIAKAVASHVHPAGASDHDD